MASYSNTVAEQPMMDINTTPLIDVMLVLLIMFIITIPIQNHAVKLDGPGDPPTHPLPPPTRNEIAVTHGDQILWNGAPVDFAQLRKNLDASQLSDPAPELTIHPASDARYEVVDKVLAVTKRAQITRMGFVGNEAYAHLF